jgi:hypothetical protein
MPVQQFAFACPGFNEQERWLTQSANSASK